MNRRPVGIVASTDQYSGRQDRLLVVCNDGAVFFLNENGDGSLTWEPNPAIPGTAAAGAKQEPEPADAILPLMRDAFGALSGNRNPVITDMRVGVQS